MFLKTAAPRFVGTWSLVVSCGVVLLQDDDVSDAGCVEEAELAEEAEQAEDDDYGGNGRYDSRDDGDDYDRRVFHVIPSFRWFKRMNT